MRKYFIGSMVLGVALLTLAACSKPFVDAKVSKDVRYVSGTFATDRQEAFYAVRWALKISGYPIGEENQTEGFVRSTWVPTKSDSHTVVRFDRADFGADGAYHQIEALITPQDGKMRIAVGSRVKSVVMGLKSTGIEERRVMEQIKDYLRVKEPEITNLGLEE